METSSPTLERDATDDTRSRIIGATAALIASGGTAAATTRAVAAAASVQAPTIYRLFGDKDGLLDAVAEDAFFAYIEKKSRRPLTDDPIADFRRDWDAHVAFGLANPEVFLLMHVRRGTPPSPAWTAGIAIVRESVRRIAQAGRLRITEESAVDLADGGVAGTVLTLMRKPAREHQAILVAAREAVFEAAFDLSDRPATSGIAGAAAALRASLDDISSLSPGERALTGELLDRVIQGDSR
ncbi:TetR/AcrR family transcriptional regulator [Herbiconiux sp. KACC 21604]|uniref:TetR/AcrR family transcriptional regulator n=1 Tax=unclassified Herbiconiux TaxID=2618217 RepID=UPI0014926744|nr:TetR/AcrR family transcriptional regulator [Herbiconiux sp. SALV-R1]QJU55305.1 TetR/AcrR family transcriptional regulator [Herbiconiux sp. SALV-R1]WPO86473.1 TetR/AcrR family transcriptional regulator [Herbiconiux sp. KACC 21604]